MHFVTPAVIIYSEYPQTRINRRKCQTNKQKYCTVTIKAEQPLKQEAVVRQETKSPKKRLGEKMAGNV